MGDRSLLVLAPAFLDELLEELLLLSLLLSFSLEPKNLNLSNIELFLVVGPGRPDAAGPGDGEAVGMRPALAGTLLLVVAFPRATRLTALSLRLLPLPPGVGMLERPLGDVDRDESLLTLLLLVLRLFPPESTQRNNNKYHNFSVKVQVILYNFWDFFHYQHSQPWLVCNAS